MRNLLRTLIVLFPICLWSQEKAEPILSENNLVYPTSSSQIRSVSGPESLIWSEDFSNGIPSTWTQQGSVATAIWEYRGANTTPSNTSGSRGNFSGVNNNPPTNAPLASPTASNGFIIFDSGYLDNGGTSSFGSGTAPSPHVGRLITDNIDLSNHPSVSLSLESYARRFYSEFYIAISTDGGQSYGDTIELFPLSVVGINGSTTNAVKSTFNISNIAGGQDSVRLMFLFDGTPGNANGNGYYFWMIDDIRIEGASPHSMRTVATNNQIPQDLIFNSDPNYPKYGTMLDNQLVSIEGNLAVTNDGSATQTNVSLDIEVIDRNTGQLVTTLSSVLGCNSLIPGDTCFWNELQTNNWTPPNQNAEYDLIYRVSSDSMQGSNALVSTDTFQLRVSDRIYSLDNGVYGNFVGTNSANPNMISIGSLFSLENEDPDSAGLGKNYIHGAEMELSAASDSTAQLQFAIYDTAGFAFNNGFPAGSTPIFTKNFTLNSNLIGQRSFFSFETITPTDTIPLALNTGSYLLIVNFFPNAAGGLIRVSNSNTFDQPGISSVMQLADGNWYSGFTNRTFESPHLALRMKPAGNFCPPEYDTLQLSNCNGQAIISPSGLYTYTQSGIYSDTLIAASGCDSIITIYANIGVNSLDSLFIQSCDGVPYISPSGTLLSQAGVYFDTLINQNGCDSIFYIDLSTGSSFQANDTIDIQHCGSSYTSASGQVWTQSGFYLDTLSNRANCDSIRSYNLDLVNISNSITYVFNGTGLLANQVNAKYQWFSCFNGTFIRLPNDTNQLYQPITNGYYAVEITIGDCVDTSSCTLVQDINLSETDTKPLRLFPNPNKGTFEIQNLSATDFRYYEVYNASGVRVAAGVLEDEVLSLPLAAGVYTLQMLNDKGQRAIQRFIVQN